MQVVEEEEEEEEPLYRLEMILRSEVPFAMSLWAESAPLKHMLRLMFSSISTDDDDDSGVMVIYDDDDDAVTPDNENNRHRNALRWAHEHCAHKARANAGHQEDEEEEEEEEDDDNNVDTPNKGFLYPTSAPWSEQLGVSKSELRRLKPRGWLNDSIINMALRMWQRDAAVKGAFVFDTGSFIDTLWMLH